MPSYMIFINPKFSYVQEIVMTTQSSFNCTNSPCQVLNFRGMLSNELSSFLISKEIDDASRCACHKNDTADDNYNFFELF